MKAIASQLLLKYARFSARAVPARSRLDGNRTRERRISPVHRPAPPGLGREVISILGGETAIAERLRAAPFLCTSARIGAGPCSRARPLGPERSARMPDSRRSLGDRCQARREFAGSCR